MTLPGKNGSNGVLSNWIMNQNICVGRPLSWVVKSMQTTWVTGSIGSDVLCFLLSTLPDEHASAAKIVRATLLALAAIVTEAMATAAGWPAIAYESGA